MSESQDPPRLNPESLLEHVAAEERRAHRGKLKIFFGSSAGTGKTYAMLQAAQAKQREGIDIIVGVVETHNRPETKALVEGLSVLPRRKVDHRGVELLEFDLDAALARKPAIILIDELAHTNAPGSRHPKRWNDVDELLNTGIDVYSTLNVQHLEALNDVVTSITGIAVQETVPDGFFDEADEVVLVDTPPDDLLKRLSEGKVYIADGAGERAAANFFKKSNLYALREMALRRTAEHVDNVADDYELSQGRSGTLSASDKLLVCVASDGVASKLIRSARRLASGMKVPWTVLHIENPLSQSYNMRQRRVLQSLLQIAERNGADVVSMQSTRIGDEILTYARQNGFARIMIGQNFISSWRQFFSTSLIDFLLRNSGPIDIFIVNGENKKLGFLNGLLSGWRNVRRSSWLSYYYAVLVVIFLTGFGLPLRGALSSTDYLLAYFTAVLPIAAKLGRGPSLLFSLLSIICLNYFFIEPYHSFTMYDRSYWLTFMVMLMASLLISDQAERLNQQLAFAREREAQTQRLYAFTRELSAGRQVAELAAATVMHLDKSLNLQSSLWMPEGAQLNLAAGIAAGDLLKEQMAARWAFDHHQPAGHSTDTLPSARGYYTPIVHDGLAMGVLGIAMHREDDGFSSEIISTAEAFASVFGTALARVLSAQNAEASRLETESERLRTTLLSSVSHDLRTPLASIAGSIGTVIESDNLTKAERLELLAITQGEVRRLSRIVNNLLDITRYEAKGFTANIEMNYFQDVLGHILSRAERLMQGYNFKVDIPNDLPLLSIDAVLVDQLVQNLLENAVRHTPKGSRIKLSAKIEEGYLHIIVSDNGPGLPKGTESRVFDKFYTIHQGERSKGIGLGLAICQAIVKLHGGSISAQNLPTGGSAFIAKLPLVQPEPKHA